MTKQARQAKIWQNTLDKIDRFRSWTNEKVGYKPPRTEVIHKVFCSENVFTLWKNTELLELNKKKRRIIL